MKLARWSLALALLICHRRKPSDNFFFSTAGATTRKSMVVPSSVVTFLGEHHFQPIRWKVRNIACIGPQQLVQRIPLEAWSFCTSAT